MNPVRPRVTLVVGTRPEAIKMAPLAQELRLRDRFDVELVVTAQHREMLDGVLASFGEVPDVDLDLMTPDQSLSRLAGRALSALGERFETHKPDAVLVHGDASTALVASVAAFYAGSRVGHVEAGLRTGHRRDPFPEEINRKVAGVVADWHFAPTERARRNLIAEGVADEDIVVTGNTVVDAVRLALPAARALAPHPALKPGRRLIVVTAHRRESFGDGILNICSALLRVADRFEDVEVAFPVHPNPQVDGLVRGAIQHQRIHLLKPLDYVPFLRLLADAHIVLTDSGGIQEEAPVLGKPVLVTRAVTERPEAVEAGTVRLVGTDSLRIERELRRLLEDEQEWNAMARAVSPYGDGRASTRIVDALEDRLVHG